jgi:hypothetical protein
MEENETGHVEGMGEMRNIYIYNILVRKYDGNRPLGRPRSRCEYNTRMDHSESV